MDSEALRERNSAPPVPKFASFRPKAIISTRGEASKAVASSASAQGRESSSKNPSSRKGLSSRAEVDRQRSRPRTNVLKTTEKTLHASIFTESLKERTDDIEGSSSTFFIDKVGDPQNLNYGGPNTGAGPPYRRAGTGGIVGLTQQKKIDRQASDHKTVVLSKLPHESSKSREKLEFNNGNEKRVLKLRKKLGENDDEWLDPMADYVSVNGPRKRRKIFKCDGTNTDSSTSSNHTRIDRYRIGKIAVTTVDQPSDEDLCYGTSTSTSDCGGGTSYRLTNKVQQRRVELSSRIDANPTCCDAWLALIDYQDSILGLEHASTRSRITKAETQSIADVRISIYEKAVEKVENLVDKERLILGMMDEAKKVWDSKKISSKWRNFVQKYPTSVILWMKYLDFKQSDFSLFRYEEVRTAYSDCLKELREVRRQSGTTDCDTIFTIQLYVILRMTVFIREAGFSEHAVASWQAILEYVFFKPVEFQPQHYQSGGPLEWHTMSAFEEFWESELPRIGEDGAEGWAAYVPMRRKPSEPKEDAEDNFIDCGHIFEAWVRSERRRSLQSRIPARTVDKDEENDPYRVVLFSDLQCVLVDPPSHSGQELVMTALIAFCHLPPYLTDCVDGRSRTWLHDPFFRNESLYQSHAFLSYWQSGFQISEPKMSTSIDSRYNPIRQNTSRGNPFRYCPPDYQLCSGSLFAASESWFSAFDSWKDEFLEDEGPLQVQWVRQVLKTLVHHDIGSEKLAEYCLALELQFSPSTVRKLAKNLIKKSPSSIRLYSSYALIEYYLGNSKSADNVIMTTINMSKTLDEQMQRESIQMWSPWIWAALLNAGPALALDRLLMFTNHTLDTIDSNKENLTSQNLTVPESSILLRTQNALVAARDQAISLGFPSHAAMAVECLIILKYLANRQSLSAARSAFTSNVDLINARFSQLSPNQEYIHQSFARLLHYHATHTAYFSPTIIRSALAESVTMFPQNTIFLFLFRWIEARFRIDDRLRSIMKDVVLSNDRGRQGEYQESVMSHFFAVHTEINRSITLGSNTHTVRGTFERGVGSNCGAHSAGLWKLYFLFEISRNELDKAKSVFYRGMKACPWAKELYMIAFEFLKTVMEESELTGLYELMVQKELRIHLELQETFDKRDER
ncbi:hypothetical protein MMC07_007425 [Pseudocyphellaria aurata]|nr:hypothetical protein [Pseudocyphellaria aurata]